MMSRIQTHTKKILRPVILAALILTSAPVFVVLDQSFSRPDTVIADDAAPEVLLPTRTTIIYKS